MNLQQKLEEAERAHKSGSLAKAEEFYRSALVDCPGKAEIHYNLALVLDSRGDSDGAVASYRNAVQLRPRYLKALNNLGKLLCDSGHHLEAVDVLHKAVGTDPTYATAIRNLTTTLERLLVEHPRNASVRIAYGSVLRRRGRLDEAERMYRTALTFDAQSTDALHRLGDVLIDQGRLEEGLASLNKAIELVPDVAGAHYARSMIYLLRGEYDRGWAEYEWRLKTEECNEPPKDEKWWNGKRVQKGKIVLIRGEQGFGDVFQFARYLPIVRNRGGKVIFGCNAKLHAILRGVGELCAPADKAPKFDLHAPLLSLPHLLGLPDPKDAPQPPYLSADPQLAEKWRGELGKGFKVGISWQGNPDYDRDWQRSIALAHFRSLADIPGVRLFSLQKNYGSEQLAEFHAPVVDLGPRIDEDGNAFTDTAAILANLDLLITSDSAIAHLAGAMGVPTWVALAQTPEWRWGLSGETTPWYPTMRLFRQTVPGDWAGVFQRITDELAQKVCGGYGKQVGKGRLLANGCNDVMQTRHGVMLCNRHDKYIGRSIERYGEFSRGEAELFEKVVQPGWTVVEAGANIGAHTLMLAKRVGPRGSVYAFEPQRVVFQMLCANMALNDIGNVYCRQEGLGETPGTVRVPPLDYGSENNFGGLSLGGETGELVPVVTLDGLDLRECQFIKVDVEGMELSVLKGAKRTIERLRPILYVENDRSEQSAWLIEFLFSLGYRLFWHLPPMFDADNFYQNPVNEFGGIASINMLGIHSSARSEISGFKEIDSPQSDWRT